MTILKKKKLLILDEKNVQVLALLGSIRLSLSQKPLVIEKNPSPYYWKPSTQLIQRNSVYRYLTNMPYFEIWAPFRPFQIKQLHSINGPPITHKDEHFAKNCIKIKCKICSNFEILPPFMSRKVIQQQKNANKKHPFRHFGASCLKTCKSTILQSILYSVPRIIVLNFRSTCQLE